MVGAHAEGAGEASGLELHKDRLVEASALGWGELVGWDGVGWGGVGWGGLGWGGCGVGLGGLGGCGVGLGGGVGLGVGWGWGEGWGWAKRCFLEVSLRKV